jgi:hypothetical protein
MASTPRLLSLSSTSASGALGRVFISGVGAAVILRSCDDAVLREMHPGVRSRFHRAPEEPERHRVPQEAEFAAWWTIPLLFLVQRRHKPSVFSHTVSSLSILVIDL